MIRRTLGLLVCLVVGSIHAEVKPNESKWWISAAVLAAASAFDAGSSWGKPEMNPLLRSADGRFGGRGFAIKMSITGGIAVMQHLVLKRQPRTDKAFIVANSAMAGAFTAAAVRNLAIERPNTAAPSSTAAGR